MRRKIEEKLLRWKNDEEGRMPLLLYGARQVGKTFILLDFGEKNYENVVYINLETNRSVASVFENDIAPGRIITLLEAIVGEEIHPGRTLLFLDEIQSCERALTSLKYFCEQAPEYHIVSAGSLLGVAVNRQQYSFPVGKVKSLSLYPLDFEEFLWAVGEETLAGEIRACCEAHRPMIEALHQKALELYHYYLIVGGMPAVVNEYVSRGKLVLVPNMQHEILGNYVADMAKYASAEEAVKIRAAFNSIPAQLAKDNRKFQYKVVQRGASSSMFGAIRDNNSRMFRQLGPDTGFDSIGDFTVGKAMSKFFDMLDRNDKLTKTIIPATTSSSLPCSATSRTAVTAPARSSSVRVGGSSTRRTAWRSR